MLGESGCWMRAVHLFRRPTSACGRRAGWEHGTSSRVVHLEGHPSPRYGKPDRRPSTGASARGSSEGYGALYGAVDAAFTWYALAACGAAQGKPDTDPPHMLIDSIRHSVFARPRSGW
jgi:hypothetical protein